MKTRALILPALLFLSACDARKDFEECYTNTLSIVAQHEKSMGAHFTFDVTEYMTHPYLDACMSQRDYEYNQAKNERCEANRTGACYAKRWF